LKTAQRTGAFEHNDLRNAMNKLPDVTNATTKAKRAKQDAKK